MLNRGEGLSSSSISEYSRYTMLELLPKLEASNPSPTPATSIMLEGEWDLKFVGGVAPGLVNSPTREIALLMYAGGFSPGEFGLSLIEKLPREVAKLESLKVTIGSTAPRSEVTASVKLFDRDVTFRVKANLDVESSTRLAESWVEAEVSGLQAVAIPANLQYTRRIFVTYLDETMALIRDETGSPTILTREAPVVEPVVLSSGATTASEDVI